VGNACGENGISSPSNDVCGIFIEGNNNIIDNNNFMGNKIGIRIKDFSMGNWVVRNLASQNSYTNFFLPPPANNYVAPVEIFEGGVFTNKNPWANFVMPY
jgi:parallel beta-helix repeat protein